MLRSETSPYLHDYKMCGDRARSACNWSDGKRCRISGRVSNRQNRVDRGSLYDCHPNDLRCSCRTTYYSIFQIFTVQSQDQLTIVYFLFRKYLKNREPLNRNGCSIRHGDDNTMWYLHLSAKDCILHHLHSADEAAKGILYFF